MDPVAQNAAMVEKLLLPYPLLADSEPEGEVIRRVGAWHDEARIARPSIFVLDRDAVVRYAYSGRDYVDRPGDEPIFETLDAMKGGNT